MAACRNFLAETTDAEGRVAVDRLLEAFRVTKPELARAAGLSRDAVSRRSRQRSRTTQARLREMVEVIDRVLPWAGSVPQAFAWYRAQPLPSFGDQTAADLVRQERAAAVKRHLSRISVGGYAGRPQHIDTEDGEPLGALVASVEADGLVIQPAQTASIGGGSDLHSGPWARSVYDFR